MGSESEDQPILSHSRPSSSSDRTARSIKSRQTPQQFFISLLFTLTLVCVWSLCVSGELYLHFPPGSNNRNREQSAAVKNPERLFSSHNSPKGGYAARPPYKFYSTSILSLHWTSDAGSGKPDELSSQFVVQYTCDDVVSGLRDGSCNKSSKQAGRSTCLDITNTDGTEKLASGNLNDTSYGLHESYAYYEKCGQRSRNMGLFLGNVSLPSKASAQYTRQNPNGTVYGTECQEERDYYPYWHPTEWKDVAVLVDDLSQCKYYQSESQNVRSKGECSLPAFNNPTDCSVGGGTWNNVAPWGIPPPHCVFDTQSSPNSMSTFRGIPFMLNWTLPVTEKEKTCVLRVRYNVSSATAGLRGLNSQSAAPLSDLSEGGWGIKLKINNINDQYGSTFEDRSFVFTLLPRPSQVAKDEVIYNFNQMGKRGRTVEVFPSLTYSFTPRELIIRQNDWVHFQWSGSDYNPPEFFGRGINGTDRGNLVVVPKDGYNVPMSIQKWNMFAVPPSASFDIGLKMALSNQKECTLRNSSDPDSDPDNCAVLNKADAYFDGGIYHLKEGSYVFINSRNHIFASVSEMGYIDVHPISTVNFVFIFVYVSMGLVAFVIVTLLTFMWARYHPSNALAKPLNKINPWAPRTGAEEGAMYLME